MAKKPSYKELEERIETLRKAARRLKRIEASHRQGEKWYRDLKRLREDEGRYRTVLDGIEEMYFEVDLAGNFTFFNDSVSKYFGYTRDELKGMNNREYMTQESSKKIFETFNRIYKTGKPEKKVSYELIRKDGSHRFHELSVSLMQDREGKPIGFHGIAHDITDLKDAVDRLKRSEEKYRTILESMEEGYFEVDFFGNFTFVNDAMCRIRGYPKEKLVGMNYTQFMDLETAKKVYKIYGRIYQTGKPIKSIEMETTRGDGTRVYHDSSVSLIRDAEGQPIGFRGVVKDITEKKKMESKLIRARDFLQNIFDSSVDGITTTDLKGTIITTSLKVKDMLGYDQVEVIGKKVYSFYENGITDAKKIMETLMKTGELRDFEMKLIKKDGAFIDVSLSGSLLKGENGELIGALGIYRDITDKKRLEAELLRSQKMEAIGTLAGGVAHDLNNILSGLVSYPELLLMDMPEDSPYRKEIVTIQKSGEKAAAIVQDLLTLARRGVSTKEIIDLNQIISDYLKSPEHEKLRSYYPGIQIETHLEEDLLQISGSPVHLSKTVMNLVSNAAEATDQGEGKISLSTGRRYLDRPIKGYGDVRVGEYVSLTVSDNGIGISPEDMERVFEPFYTKKVMGRSGTGLGMTVVWGTVKDHNGYIEVQSIKGLGTTFTLYFPVAMTKAAEEEPAMPIEDFRGKGESVLVVDDVEEQRIIATGMLNKLGYSATSVSCGEDAIEHVKHNNCDLLILDMIMDQGMDGLETYKRVLELHPGQKAIIASGFSPTYRVTETQRLGAGEYIKKPYTLERIGLAVRKELRREINYASEA